MNPAVVVDVDARVDTVSGYHDWLAEGFAAWTRVFVVSPSRLPGHASAATTAKYYQHADNEIKRDAVARLSASVG